MIYLIEIIFILFIAYVELRIMNLSIKIESKLTQQKVDFLITMNHLRRHIEHSKKRKRKNGKK